MAHHSNKTANNSPIAQGIKAVAVGKKGSKPIPSDLIDSLISDLKNPEISPVAKGAFIGALILKGVTEEEKQIETIWGKGSLENYPLLIEKLSPNIPSFVKECCVRLLDKDTLDVAQAKRLGDFLFSQDPGDEARGLIASILRVRYETPDEYEGLLSSLNETIEAPFRKSPPEGDPIIQIAEPFDGVDHSNAITPLLAQYLQTLNYRILTLVGRNSGPKFGNNLLDLAEILHGDFLKSNQALGNKNPQWGWYLKQKDMSQALDRWVEIRHQTIKRPFLATIERFANPANADIMIASAFHPPYGEKMLTVCERAGFNKTIIVRNGMEGTIAFPLKRSAKILCSRRIKNNSFQHHEFEFNAEGFFDRPFTIEEKLIDPPLAINAELIQTYTKQGATSNELFDHRVKATCEGIKIALKWVTTDSTES